MLAAQGFLVSGRVLHAAGGDSTPLAGAWAVLHQVSMTQGAPVDSVRTDAAGRYRLRAPARDTAAVYIVSSTYGGIAYFTRPLHPARGATTGAADELVVFDTSATSPVVELAQRHVIVRQPEADGSRSVLELLVLRNNGDRTRVAPDTGQPVWQGVLPRGAIQLAVGESDVSSEAVYRRGDSVAVAAPVPPGEKQIVVSYVLPRPVRRLELTLDQAVGRVNLLIEDPGAKLEDGPLEHRPTEEFEGASFARFEADNARTGAHVSVRFSATRYAIGNLWWLIVGLAGLVMAAGLVLAWRRTRPEASPLPTAPEAVAAQIAALDAAFEARSEPTAPERAAYRHQRDTLKARLEALLARRDA